MSFFRHREIFRSDVIRLVRERRSGRPRPHRLDEFPAGYSSADCSPAGSASASPTEDHSALKSSCRSILFHRTVNSVLTVCLSPGDHPNLCDEFRKIFSLKSYSRVTRTSLLERPMKLKRTGVAGPDAMPLGTLKLTW